MSGKHLMAQQAGQLHGEVKSQDVTISGTFPTAIPPDGIAGRKDFILQNGSAVDIWIGGSDVTQYNGIKVSADGVFGAQFGRANLYAITASTTVSGIRILEVA
jgi:hypothetical protein